MKTSEMGRFDSATFINHLADELVRNMSAASQATTPGLIGSAREHEIRNKLAALFPEFVGVGTGCVIDTSGAASHQTDIVLYERHNSPRFSVNEDQAATYYPCEGVIAVGEVKSRLDAAGLREDLAKIASSKALKRWEKRSQSIFPSGGTYSAFRRYGSSISMEGDPSEDFNQQEKSSDQIYGFLLCRELGMRVETLCTIVADLGDNEAHSLAVNTVVCLERGALVWLDENNRIVVSRHEARNIGFIAVEDRAFQFLVQRLHAVIRTHRTVPHVPLERYIGLPERFNLSFVRSLASKT